MMISVVSDDGMPMVSSKAIEIGVIEKRKGDEPQSELFDKYRS
jgi:hypothetical protein